ncbi:histidine phosphatase family protein [Streptomyces sp. NPDC008001]|uniref:histidine phosphatase family protein n=1 Tax=Streptomyces sp. NPDC008001 TaxID=3364804 RepID=UPI0036E6154C
MTHGQMWLVRHGESEMAVQKRLSGHNDSPLTEAGRGHAEAASRTVRALSARTGRRPTRVVSSPVARAWQTGEIIAESLGLPLSACADLAETDFGAWDGLSSPEIVAGWPELIVRWRADKSTRPPGGETFAETAVRVCAALKEIARAGEEAVIVVSHSNPIKAAAASALLGVEDRVLEGAHLDFGGTSRFEISEKGDWTLLSWNEVNG